MHCRPHPCRSGWWFQTLCHFYPYYGGDHPMWLVHIFSGWGREKPPTSLGWIEDSIFHFCSRNVTPPKFNIAPERWWLEDYFPFGKATFQGRTVNFQVGNDFVSFPMEDEQTFGTFWWMHSCQVETRWSVDGDRVSPTWGEMTRGVVKLQIWEDSSAIMKWDPYFGGIKVDEMLLVIFEGFVHNTRNWGW